MVNEQQNDFFFVKIHAVAQEVVQSDDFNLLA